MAGELMSLFQSGNPFLIDEAYKQLGQGTEKTAADIAQTQALTNKTNTMLPAELAHTQALTESAKQQARTQRIKSDTEEGVPLADRTAAYWNELRGKSSDAQLKVLDNNMEAMRYYATKPNWSLEDQTTMQKNYPGLFEQLSSPTGRQIAAKAYDDYIKHSGKYMTEEMKSKYHLQGIQTTANAGLQSMREQINAGKFWKPGMASVNAKIDMEHDPAKKQAMLIDAASQAGVDTPEGQTYLARAQALDAAVVLQRGGTPKGNTPNKEALGIPTNPTPSAMPNGKQWTPPNGWK